MEADVDWSISESKEDLACNAIKTQLNNLNSPTFPTAWSFINALLTSVY